MKSLVAALTLALLATAAQALDLQGHRGARALAPENSLAGFELAIQLGASTLELDAAITRDGVVVVHHDLEPNPVHTRDAQGRWLEGDAVLAASVLDTVGAGDGFAVGRTAAGFHACRPPCGISALRLRDVKSVARTNDRAAAFPDEADHLRHGPGPAGTAHCRRRTASRGRRRSPALRR